MNVPHEEAIDNFPLAWPAGWTRCTDRKRSRFATSKGLPQGSGVRYREITIADGVQRVMRELYALDVPYCIISTNIKPTLTGTPHGAGGGQIIDPGAAVYWKAPRTGAQRCIAVDLYDRVADNLAAIAATLEAMRAIKRHGGAAILERAFTGFKALPAPEQWFEILELGNQQASEAEIEAAFIRLAKAAHPDTPNGNHNAMVRLNDARDRGLAAARARY